MTAVHRQSHCARYRPSREGLWVRVAVVAVVVVVVVVEVVPEERWEGQQVSRVWGGETRGPGGLEADKGCRCRCTTG